jgi:hypothetical protein
LSSHGKSASGVVFLEFAPNEIYGNGQVAGHYGPGATQRLENHCNRERGRHMDSVHQLLDRKGTDVWWVAPDTSVYDALVVKADRNIGALVVPQGGETG